MDPCLVNWAIQKGRQDILQRLDSPDNTFLDTTFEERVLQAYNTPLRISKDLTLLLEIYKSIDFIKLRHEIIGAIKNGYNYLPIMKMSGIATDVKIELENVGFVDILQRQLELK